MPIFQRDIGAGEDKSLDIKGETGNETEWKLSLEEREKTIERIKLLYPANDGNETGQALLFRAIADRWECLPDDILLRYLSLCIAKENEF